MASAILSNMTVIDMTEGVAGPYATMILGDMGASVVKVERKAGDWGRGSHPDLAHEANAQFVALNRNKRDLGLDLGRPEGIAAMERLVKRADVFLSNFRAGVVAKLGLGYERCRELKPDIIYVTVSGFGQEGPYAQNPASDTIIQAMSGIMSLCGEADGPPLRVGFPLIDMAAANQAVQSVLLALLGRMQGRGGACIDISLMAAGLSMMSAHFTRYLNSGKLPQRQGNQNVTLSPAGAFKTSDGRYISVAVLRDEHWRKLCGAMGIEHLIDDERFRINEKRVVNRAALDEIIAPMFATEPAAYWLGRLGEADILCGPINTLADVAAEPALIDRLPIVDPMVAGMAKAMGSPIRYDGSYFQSQRSAPRKGQHTREVLSELGYGADEIDALIRSGVAFTAD